MNDDKSPKTLAGDNPIQRTEDDVLKRAGVADAFARQVLALDASAGNTVGVFGPWGSGKTSFVNLARGAFERAEVRVIDFNPWMFSGTEQLVERFLAELSAECKAGDLGPGGKPLEENGATFLGKVGAIAKKIRISLRQLSAKYKAGDLGSVGEALEEYGDALSGTAGAVAKIIGISLRHREGGISGRREKVATALRDYGKRIIVVLDDVDRLSVSEIREVFKLVRLTASFPNLVYVVACDRHRVERALGEPGLQGRDYLEKIIQWPFNLPEVPSHLLTQQLSAAIEEALADIEDPGPFDKQVWPDVFDEIVRPLVSNMRDVRRYAIAIRETVAGLDGEVALTDALGLEAVRLFLPDVFRHLPSAIDGLTVTSRAAERRLFTMTREDPSDPMPGFNKWLKAQIDRLISAVQNDPESETDRTGEVVEAMIDRLFPVGARLRRMSDGDSEPYANDDAAEHLVERRVAHDQVLRLYLERVASPDLLDFHDAERALARMTDRDRLNEFIRSLEPTRWQDVVSNLCDLGNRFRPEHVEAGVVVLLGLWPDMPERLSGSSFVGDTRASVRRTTYRLLSALEDTVAVEAVVRRILPEVKSLSSKLELVLQIGHREKSGHKLVSETAAHEFETILWNEIRAASAEDLAEERDASRVVAFAKHYVGPLEEPFEIDVSPKLTFALLRSVRGEMETGSLGSRAVRRSPVLNWERVVDLYGGEEVLETRINDLKARFEILKPWIETCRIPLDEAEHLLELADRYLSGWRPEAD